MNNIKRILLIIFCAVMLFSGIACSCNSSTVDPGGDDTKTPAIPSTGRLIVEDGESSYKIVMPKEAAEYEEFAAGELRHFFAEATGKVLEIVTDEGIGYSDSAKYLSVGNTAFRDSSGQEYDKELGDSGFKIVTKGDSVFMSGYRSEGTLYAVYDFLYYSVGYEFFADDEIKIDSLTDVELLAFDYKSIPSIQRRSLGYKPLWNSKQYTRRLRFVNFDQDYIIDGHTFGTILPHEKYVKDHPEWFADTADAHSQPCLTNMEAFAEFVENSKVLIREKPEGKFFMLGQNDNGSFCACKDCTAAKDKYYSVSGVLIDFVNRVSKALDEWLAIEFPGRELTYVTYAYLESLEAPVRLNHNTGVYTPAHDDVIPRENVVVMITPLNAEYTYSFSDSRNSSMKSLVDSWGSLTSNLFIYSYCVNFSQYFIPHNNFGILAENYRFADSYDIYAYYEQGANQSNTNGFMELKFYLISQLMWNPSLDPVQLTDKFLRQFYGPAYESMNEYYFALRTWYGYLQEVYDPPFKVTLYADVVKKAYWPFDLLNSWEKNIFDKAFESIEYLKTIDEALYNKYHGRINKELLTIKFLYISLHQAEFMTSEVIAMINDFERDSTLYQQNYYQEGKYTKDIIAEWRKNL